MMICHCLAVNDRAIADLAADANVSVDDVVEMCGAGGQCGGCRDAIGWVLSRSRSEAGVLISVGSSA